MTRESSVNRGSRIADSFCHHLWHRRSFEDNLSLDDSLDASSLGRLASKARLNGGRYVFRFNEGILGPRPDEPVTDMVVRLVAPSTIEVELITEDRKKLEKLFGDETDG